jgi:predicted dienelactone hydrolase
MRPLEILLLFLVGGSLLTRAPNRDLVFRGISALPALAVIVSTLQIALEGYRWQLLPAYGLAITVFALAMIRRADRKPTGSWSSNLLALLAFFFAGALPVLLPVPRLNSPDGPYAVGTRTLELIDTSRTDPYAPDANQPRRLLVQLWYPAEQASGGRPAPWMEAAEIVAPAVAAWINLPSFFLDHLALSRSPAFQDVEVAPGERFPLVLFSHGYGGFRAQNTNQAINLASHGYIVAAVEHTYGAVLSVFPDGSVAYHNPETLPSGLSEQESLQATRRLGEQWAGDLAYVLGYLSSLDQTSTQGWFSNRLDMDWVGVMGHSTGGGAAIEFCGRDPRCDAILTMDPYLKPVSQAVLQLGLGVPALHLFSESWTSTGNRETFSTFTHLANADSWTGSITGTAHYDFTDLPLLTPLAAMIGLKGPIAGPQVVEIVNAYTLAFFDYTLLGSRSELIPGLAAPFAELELRLLP